MSAAVVATSADGKGCVPGAGADRAGRCRPGASRRGRPAPWDRSRDSAPDGRWARPRAERPAASPIRARRSAGSRCSRPCAPPAAGADAEGFGRDDLVARALGGGQQARRALGLLGAALLYAAHDEGLRVVLGVLVGIDDLHGSADRLGVAQGRDLGVAIAHVAHDLDRVLADRGDEPPHFKRRVGELDRVGRGLHRAEAGIVVFDDAAARLGVGIVHQVAHLVDGRAWHAGRQQDFQQLLAGVLGEVRLHHRLEDGAMGDAALVGGEAWIGQPLLAAERRAQDLPEGVVGAGDVDRLGPGLEDAQRKEDRIAGAHAHRVLAGEADGW